MAIYAVLVGINGYPQKPLSGCLNDVQAVENYLNQFSVQANETLHVHKLTDDTTLPTRKNLLDSFHFFADAVANDFCLFYYSGHGSFSLAPAAFWAETDGYNESFVCIDSRTEGGRDLMDKEMGYLIWQTFRNKPDVTFIVITDCCHSGTITKEFLDNSGITDRMQSPDNRLSVIQDYYGFGESIDGEMGYVVSTDGNKVTLKSAKHIHIAASRDNQTSKELLIDGSKRGAFTDSFLKTLNTAGGLISYKELVEKAAALVKNLVSDQQPGINPNGYQPGEKPENNFFLSQNGSISNPLYFIYSEPKYGWCIKAGRLQGVSKGDKVIIAGVCETTVTANVSADLSTIASQLPLGKSTNTYRASVVRQSVRPLVVSFGQDMDAATIALIEKAAAENPSPYVKVSNEISGQYIIHAEDGAFFMNLPGSNRPVFKPLSVADDTEALFFLERIEIVSKWKYLQELENAETKLTANDYSLQLYHSTQACNYEEKNFEEIAIEPINDFYYKKSGEDWCQPAMRLSFTNNSSRDLCFACAYLGFDYSITDNGFSNIQVGKGLTKSLSFQDGPVLTDIIKLKIESTFQDLGYTEISEYLKLFVSTEKLDPGVLNQGGIDLPVFGTKSLEADDKGLGSVVKSFGGIDWKTETIALHIVKPQDETAIIPGRETIINEVRILPHDALNAKISITSSANTARSAEGIAPPHQVNKNTYLQPYNLMPFLQSETVMDVLELMDIQNADTVTPDAPLVIAPAATKSTDEENIIPVGYDKKTGLYYPLGYTNVSGNIVINTLPDDTDSNEAITQKSFLGSISIYLQKVVGQKLGFAYHYPRLAIATVIDDKVNYEADEQKVQEAVKGATSIALFIHGIIGDTEGMVKCVQTELENAKTLEQQFDLLLAFDYENLNTEIEVTAADLKKCLTIAGFTKEDGKQLTIIAHSMGGLVSRWFIEKLDGHELSDRLIMLGTPNNGSPWADVRDLADTLLTYAINGAAFLKPWMFVLSGIGRLVKGVQITLKEMDAKTGMYDRLNDGTVPKVPYTFIAGNTRSIIPKYDETAGLVSRLFTKLKKKGVYDALDLVLFRVPNDIAASDESIVKIKGSENNQDIHEVPTDHLNYFINPESLALIYKTV